MRCKERARSILFRICSAIAHAMLMPSKVLVPLPTSSRMIRLFGVALWMMFEASSISTMNVLWPLARKSEAPMRVNILSVMPILGCRCGYETSHLRHERDKRNLPHIGRLAGHIRPGKDEQQLSVLLVQCAVLVRYKSFSGEHAFQTGCLPSDISMTGSSAISGFA